jgi:radical SAM protein with 4Fe4S-binding SPASM domain
MEGYPVLKDDIFFAKIWTDAGMEVKIRNTTTEKDFKPTYDTVLLLVLCDGTNTVEKISEKLSNQSGEPVEALTEEINSILEILLKKGIITFVDTPLDCALPPAKEVRRKYITESAQIEITNKCNLSCLHCFNNSGESCPKEFTTPEILSLIDVLSSMGVHKITLTGGEPFLHPDLFQIVEHARKAPMTVTIFTNGTLITEEDIQKCKEVHVKFAVSVDSYNSDTHDRFRGQKGALHKTLHSINILKNAGLPVRISVSLSQVNKHELIDTLTYFKDHDLIDYHVAEVNISGRGRNEVVIPPEEFYKVLVDQLNFEKSSHTMNKRSPKPEGGCGIAQSLIYIKADGTILPCHACHQDMGVGNVRDVDLPTFWDSNETLEMLRNMRAENDYMCKECPYITYCDGCIGNAFISERKYCCYDLYACARFKAYDTVELLE